MATENTEYGTHTLHSALRTLLPRLLLLVGALLIVIWGGRVLRAGLSLREHLRQARALVDAPEGANPLAACDLLSALRADVETLQREAGWLVRAAPALGWLPGVGSDLRAAPHLLAVADDLTLAGTTVCNELSPLLNAVAGDEGTVSPEQVVRGLADARPELERALAAVERAQGTWADVDVSRLSARTARWTATVDRLLPLLRVGLGVAVIAPDLLGADGPRTYLILAQNEDELRPTGGFLTGVGEIRLEGGRVVSMTFRDSYAVDDFSQPYPDPPEPLRRYMGIDLWVFRDSNWSPDFPTAVRQAVALYRPGHPVTVDGVIALDQYAVRELVDALGPLAVEGADEPVTGETVIPYIRQAWAPEGGQLTRDWWRGRKSFMGPLAQAAWERLQDGQVHWRTLAETLSRLLDGKHILLYFVHPRAQSLLAARNWDGALRPGTGDFLTVVDANVGYNKASARVQQAIIYEVDLSRRPPQVTLTLVYTHTGPAGYPCQPEVRYDPVYEQMMDRCLWDYVRIYVPRGSRLLDATRIPVPGDALWSGETEPGEVTVRPAEEGPFLPMETLLLLPPGTAQTRSFTWELPEDVVAWHGDEGTYTLRVQKQPGTVGHPLRVRVHLGDGLTLLSASPTPVAVDGSALMFQMLLDRDREITVRFRRGQ